MFFLNSFNKVGKNFYFLGNRLLNYQLFHFWKCSNLLLEFWYKYLELNTNKQVNKYSNLNLLQDLFLLYAKMYIDYQVFKNII